MVYKVVNRDTGEVADLRDEPEPVPFDVLPKHFRPSEAWQPEHEVWRCAGLFDWLLEIG